MSLNDGFLEIFIFRIVHDIYTYDTFKVVMNFTKGMCTVYAPNGRILMRIEKLSRMEMNKIKKQVNDYINGKSNQLPNFNNRSGRNFREFRTA